MFLSNPFWVVFCLCCNIVVQFHSFACGYPAFPTPFVERITLVPTVYSWNPGRYHLIKCSMDFFLGSLFSSIAPYVCLYASTYCFHYCCSVIKIEIKTEMFPCLLFEKITLAILHLSWVSMNFHTLFLFL
jgi:hypothetical protein